MRETSLDLWRLGLTAGALSAGLLAAAFARSGEIPDLHAKSTKVDSIVHVQAVSIKREVSPHESGRQAPVEYGETRGAKTRTGATRHPRVVLAWVR